MKRSLISYIAPACCVHLRTIVQTGLRVTCLPIAAHRVITALRRFAETSKRFIKLFGSLNITPEMQRPTELSQADGGLDGIRDFPPELLADVLSYIEQGDRLRCCALVSKAWRHAAYMATTTIQCSANVKRGMDDLSAWLASNQHADRIQRLQVKEAVTVSLQLRRPVLQMPFIALRQLQYLKLPGCQLKTTDTAVPTTGTAASTISAPHKLTSLGALTALSTLELKDCILDLSELSSCTGLQYLVFNRVQHAQTRIPSTAATEHQPQQIDDLYPVLPSQLPIALPQLTRLTHLQISYPRYEANEAGRNQLVCDMLAALSNLQQLKALHLSVQEGTFEAEDLASLPLTLTALHIYKAPKLTVSTACQFQQLTQLQELHISDTEFDPQLLSGLTQLTYLCLDNCPFDDAPAVTDLFTALQELKQLKVLKLPACLYIECEHPPQYSALVASSQLEELDLTDCHILWEESKHILLGGNCLSALSSLVTSPDLLFDIGSFGRLVASCPVLQELCIMQDECREEPVWIDIQGMSPLSNLTSLTKLSLNKLHMNDKALESIGACTQLKDLVVEVTYNSDAYVTLDGLMQLTQLTGLTNLTVSAVMKNLEAFEEFSGSAESPGVLHLLLREEINMYPQ